MTKTVGLTSASTSEIERPFLENAFEMGCGRCMSKFVLGTEWSIPHPRIPFSVSKLCFCLHLLVHSWRCEQSLHANKAQQMIPKNMNYSSGPQLSLLPPAVTREAIRTGKEMPVL